MRINRLALILFMLITLISCQPDHTIIPTLPPPAGPLTDTTIQNISYGANATQKLDLGLPAGRTATTPLVIIVHGGGWSSGDKTELSWLLNGLKQRGFAAANINYRLALTSADNYKMELDDLDSAIQFTLRQSTQYSFNGQKLYIVGHSAGGHLSLCYAYTRNANGKVKAVSAMAGPSNLFSMSYYNPVVFNPILQPFLGVPLYPITIASEQRYKSCSPQYQVTSSSSPTILFHGESDFFITPDQSTNLAFTLGTLGVDKKVILYPFTFHDWWADGTKTANTMDELKTWFNAHP
ncbi:MAG: alpha/beta hydrolase [Bacteroidota bacterium]